MFLFPLISLLQNLKTISIKRKSPNVLQNNNEFSIPPHFAKAERQDGSKSKNVIGKSMLLNDFLTK